jgi:hypothetical protein
MLANASAVKLREYERIFTGSNQDIGYENPILGFTSDTTLLTLPVDKITYFHYPMSAPSGLLVNSDLVNAGAVAGTTPYRSDKIWKKLANYASTSIWGNTQPVGKQTGIWLCSWLSGNPADQDVAPVWKDRWFNPGYIDPFTALFVSNPISSIIIDIDSQMTFDKGCWYRYFHIGNEYNQNIVNSLTGNSNLKLHLDDWSQNPIELSPFNNISNIQNYTTDSVSYLGVNPTEKPLDSCLNLDGINQDCRVLYNSSYTLTGNMSYSIWAYSQNWNEVQGNHILSKNYRGGWSLKYSNGFFTPIIFVSDITNGNIVFLNSDGKIIFNKALPTGSNPRAAIVDNELFTYVLDNGIYEGAKHLYKIDYTGDIIDFVNFNTSETLKNIAIDGNNDLWVLSDNSISGFDSNLDCTSAFNVLSTINYIDFNVNGILGSNEFNFVYTTSGNSIVAQNSAIVVTCDRYDNIWKLEGANTFIKSDPTNSTVLLSGLVGISTDLSGRNINFTNEYVNGTYVDYVWFLQQADQSIYKYDTDGILIKRIDLSKYNVNPYVMNDFTGYQRCRKFDFAKYGRTPQVKADITLKVSDVSAVNLTLSIPSTSIANNEWHMFTFTYDQSAINLYMDAMLRDSKTISYDNSIFYKYENCLLLGANIGKNLTVDEELDLDKLHFKGKLDDLRIYDIVLNNSDIRHIYLNKFNYHNIKWNMPSGEQSYLEEIERFFKFKLPGMKSQYFNIKLKDLNITDENIRSMIEDIIKNTIKKVTPAYSQLYKIIWE